jgi:hypothetical protein
MMHPAFFLRTCLLVLACTFSASRKNIIHDCGPTILCLEIHLSAENLPVAPAK